MGDISSYGILLARTDDVPKRQGITFFLIDMHQPGVTVRPLVQITGDAEFCETFLDDARVPDAWRLGELNDGWNVSKFVLANERTALAGSSHAVGRTVGSLIKRQRRSPTRDTPARGAGGSSSSAHRPALGGRRRPAGGLPGSVLKLA
jgi:alkylation response protein AidB-like acyl-CoA dehydrogenase